MARSDYTYRLVKSNDNPCIIIEDLDNGRMSVTNDIENVIEEIAQKEDLNPVEHIIVYKDSDGIWDGFNFSTQQFVSLNCDDANSAVSKYIKIME